MNNYNSTYKKDAELFVKFLKEFEEDTAQGRVKKYWMQCVRGTLATDKASNIL